jgi:hypothetical protein
MLDFLTVATRSRKPGITEVYPKFLIQKSEDLMIRGGDFYAVWVEDRGLWSTDENDVVQLVDRELKKYAEEHKEELEGSVRISYMWDAESGVIDSWHKYCQRQLRDSYHMLDEKLLFSNDGTNKKDYASKRLSYPLEAGECPAYEKIISTLYSEEERHKLEWAIGSIVTGESKDIQKFLVLYGGPGTGKSTILNIIQDLFDGYHAVFDAKALGSANAQFALEPFKKNPLVAIQHDGDLSRIEDNTRLNSVVSHEWMSVNEKHKSQYENRFICFLFMGTNKPVKITDGKSGILRRLIDVSPSGNKIGAREYKKLINQVKFELGPIAYHCKEVYLANPGAYDDYIPTSMMGASNDFYNFMIDSYHVFRKEDGTTLKAAWEMYKTYVDEAKVPYSLSKMHFKSELMNYFKEFNERFVTETGERARSYYSGFRTDKFETGEKKNTVEEKPTDSVKEIIIPEWLKMDTMESIFDKVCASYPAQKASSKETPSRKWDEVTTVLSKLDTSKLHYVKVPDNHIVIDFDIKDETGNKSYQKNLEAAKGWPPTYAELSKSGAGIHLHYIYSGDVTKLSRIYEDDIEIKVFTGKSSLRRMLTKCNNQPIATISSGLPLKGDDKLINWDGIKNERMLRTMIKRNLNKEYHGATKPSVDYIAKLLEDAYNSGIGYDVGDMRNDIFAFAAGSTNQADYCIKLVNRMKFKSEEANPSGDVETDELVFYDVEVFPNLFLVNWKVAGEGRPVVRMINPKPSDIEELLKFKLVGFNCRRYDNHILYSRLMGYTNEQIYNLSKKIINADKGEKNNAFFREAYNLSYTDVYDFAAKKMSLKKWEIELGIGHKELGMDWDADVPEDRWEEVAAYCDWDVICTEKVFDHLKGDWTARQILADLADGSVNDTTNTLTTKIIFGKERKPNLVYTDLSTGEQFGEPKSKSGTVNSFPGYEYIKFGDDNQPHNMYRGTDIGFGGYIISFPNIYSNVALLDIVSLHPNSIRAMNCFGEYTKNFTDILDARVAIKHGDYDTARQMLNGRLASYLEDESTAKDLAQALKIAINSVYGLTAASFNNPFRDPRNVNNIVALRGALFMRTLQDEVENRGYPIVAIKTDSIKIANADKDIIDFCMEFARKYSYQFEHEATYDRMCQINDADYIAKYADPKYCESTYGYIPGDNAKASKKDKWWTATGKQFQIPYVFKTLFSKEPIEFEDFCEAKEVKTAIYLDMDENLPDGEHDYHFIGKVGNFCPIMSGKGGGILVRENKDKNGNTKYDSVTGTLKPDKTPYRWLEADAVKLLGKESDIDKSYHRSLVDKAVGFISEHGDFERFVADEPYIGDSITDFPIDDESDLPWYSERELAEMRAREEAESKINDMFNRR